MYDTEIYGNWNVVLIDDSHLITLEVLESGFYTKFYK